VIIAVFKFPLRYRKGKKGNFFFWKRGRGERRGRASMSAAGAPPFVTAGATAAPHPELSVRMDKLFREKEEKKEKREKEEKKKEKKTRKKL
jgi:hypothetical protein